MAASKIRKFDRSRPPNDRTEHIPTHFRRASDYTHPPSSRGETPTQPRVLCSTALEAVSTSGLQRPGWGPALLCSLLKQSHLSQRPRLPLPVRGCREASLSVSMVSSEGRTSHCRRLPLSSNTTSFPLTVRGYSTLRFFGSHRDSDWRPSVYTLLHSQLFGTT